MPSFPFQSTTSLETSPSPPSPAHHLGHSHHAHSHTHLPPHHVGGQNGLNGGLNNNLSLLSSASSASSNSVNSVNGSTSVNNTGSHVAITNHVNNAGSTLSNSSNGTSIKYGTLVPNRVFVGGISSTTTEADLHKLFSTFGNVKATKIISDRGGCSKGYGFVTFETEEEAKKLQAEVSFANSFLFRYFVP